MVVETLFFRFQSMLESCKDMSGQLRLLQIACSAKSRPRNLTLTRASRDDPLPFNIMGGADNGYGIYVNHVSRTPEKCLTHGIKLISLMYISRSTWGVKPKS